MAKDLFRNIYNRECGLRHPNALKNSTFLSTAATMIAPIPLNRKAQVGSEFTHLTLDYNNQFMLACTKSACVYLYQVGHKVDFKALASSSRYDPAAVFTMPFSINTINWHPHDTGMFFTSGSNGNFSIWDTKTFTVVDEIEVPGSITQHDVYCDTTAAVAAIATSEKKVHLVDIRTGSTCQDLEVPDNPHALAVLCCQWNPTDEFILATSGADGYVYLWDTRFSSWPLTTFRAVRKPDMYEDVKSHPGYVFGLAFNPGGRYLVTESDFVIGKCKTQYYYELRCWDLTTYRDTTIDYPKLVGTPATKKAGIRICIDGYNNDDLIFAPSHHSIRVIEMRTGKLVNTLMGGHYSQVTNVVSNKVKMEAWSGDASGALVKWQRALSGISDILSRPH